MCSKGLQMLHFALLADFLFQSGGVFGGGTRERRRGRENQQQHPTPGSSTEGQPENLEASSSDRTFTVVTARHVESVDKICETSLITTRSVAQQANTCSCYTRQRDIFERILSLSTQLESDRLEQLREFITIEVQIADDKDQAVQEVTSQAIDYVRSYGNARCSGYVTKNLLQCMAYICYYFQCTGMVKHLIRAYEKLIDRQKILAPGDSVSWLLWFPLANRSSLLYSMKERQRWPQILSFLLSAASPCQVASVYQQQTGHTSKISNIMYPLLEVRMPFNDRMHTPLSLACLQRRVSVCLTLLQHGAQVIVADHAQRSGRGHTRKLLLDTIEQPLNIVVHDFNTLAVTAGLEEEQYRVFSLLKLLMKSTLRVRTRFVDDIGLSDCRKCLIVGSGVAVVLLDSLYQPMIEQWASMYSGVDSLRQLCRHAVRQCLKRNGNLPRGVKLLPITTDLKEVIMLLK